MDQLTKFLATTRGRVMAAGWGLVVLAALAFFGLNLAPGAGSGAVKPLPVVHHPHPKPTTQPVASKPGTPVISSSIPPALAASLIDHEVIVVEIFNPGQPSDPVIDDLEAHKEAKLGAAQAGAGFVAVDVRNEAEMQLVSNVVTVSSDPFLFILDRAGTVLFKRSGYLDAETIAQAAVNALAGSTAADKTPVGPKDGISGPYDGYWKAKVDQIGCASNALIDQVAALSDLEALPTIVVAWQKAAAELRSLRAVGPDAWALPQIVADVESGAGLLQQIETALRKNKAVAFNAAAKRFVDVHNHLSATQAKIGVACFTKKK